MINQQRMNVIYCTHTVICTIYIHMCTYINTYIYIYDTVHVKYHFGSNCIILVCNMNCIIFYKLNYVYCVSLCSTYV